MTDEEIIALLTSTNPQPAFVHLFRCRSKINAFIVKQGGKKEDAQDIFQEALIILWRKVNDPTFVLTSQLNTYLIGIAKMLWLNLRKKEHKFRPVEFPSSDIISDIESHADEESKFLLAEKALRSIAATCQQILNLFYIEKISMSEIARILDLGSDNSAKTRKYKCLEQARKNYLTLHETSMNNNPISA